MFHTSGGASTAVPTLGLVHYMTVVDSTVWLQVLFGRRIMGAEEQT